MSELSEKETLGKTTLGTKLLLLAAILLGAASIVVEALGLSDAMDIGLANLIALPMIGTILLLSGLFNLNKGRAISVLCFLVAGAAYIVFVVWLLMRLL